jgi:hypothetical protein
MKVIWSLVVTIIIVCCIFSLPSNSYITHSILVKNQFLNKLNINRRNFNHNNYRNHVIQLSSSSSSTSTTTDDDIDMSDSLLEILNEEPAIVASDDVTTIIPEITKFPTKISDVKEEVNYQPQGTSYCICSQCKTAYLIDITILTSKGSRVQCNVCDKDWFQTPERLMRTDEYHVITKMNDDKVLQVKKIIAEKNFPKYPRVDKVGVFIGNLPYTYTEKEIGDLFGEYGLTNIALVKDAEQQSKGYGFLEVTLVVIVLFIMMSIMNDESNDDNVIMNNDDIILTMILQFYDL